MPTETVLGCQLLSFCWQGDWTLAPLSFELRAGERLGVIGPNGAGKSTLLKLLAGLCQPSSGSVLLQGKPLTQYSRTEKARQLALLSQENEQAQAMTVAELMLLGLLPHKKLWQANSQADLNLLKQCLVQVGLSHKQHQLLSSLSGGELQRAQLGRVLMQGATLILLDEPTNHLDIQYQHQLLQLIASLPLSLIASFHDLNLAASYCDRLLLLHQGKVMALGTPQQVLTAPLISTVFGRPCLVDENPFDGKPRLTFAPGDCV
ncbi:ABC transporter ATP-binding protein [Rheinheimera sp. 4Y26]|nr:ABC transporter ATP-binding protein [Rheinheimera sp. 4Y26]MCT6699097.1 ABC transporter ATP-binding protein [Rheinheimera sp. 4Y26]